METKSTIDSQFQQDIQRLGILSGNEDTLDAFTDEYKRVLEENYNSMMQCRNTGKLLEGAYRTHAEMLKAILIRQMNHFGLTWPDDTRLSKVDHEEM